MINKEDLKKYLELGMSSRDIEKVTGIKYYNILTLIEKYELNNYNKYQKPSYKDVHYFNKINTKEKAYILGFFLGDGCIDKEDKFEINIMLEDKEVADFIALELGCNLSIDKILNKNQRRFPNVGIKIGNNILVRDLKMLFGGRLKEERHIPIISKSLEKYLLQGFFDAEGCITWGYRKDRNRIWQKISFTSQYKMLEGIQNILLKNNIATKIHPKSKEKCYVMEFASKDKVLEFINWLYPNDEFIILHRKYNKAQALRLELGEFGES